MSVPNPDDLLLLIRCPSCGQRFKVGDDLRDRTVECGGCEHRFRINDDVIVRGRKFYPGERDGHSLNRFQRVPLPGGESLIGVQPIRYSAMPEPAVLEPASPQRIVAGVIGASGIILMALLLMFGASRGGLLDGMILTDRLLMAGFASLIGVALLVYANPRARLKALSVGLLLSGCTVAVPFFFQTGSVPLEQRVVATPRDLATEPEVNPQESTEDTTIVALRTRIGTGPLVAEIDRLAKSGSGKRAMGMWFRGLSESNKNLVKEYILRVTGADPSSHPYPRDGGDYLLVVTGVTQSIQELAELASVLGIMGKTEKIYPEISVIEVRVNNDIFVEGPIEKLSKKDDPAFYDLNKRELESIDLQRVKRAVQRIAEAEPKIYRVDITRKLIALLGEDTVDFKDNICKALSVWSEQPGPAGEAALGLVKKLSAKNEPIPPEIIALVVKEKNAGVIPILDELWFKNPLTWESLYADFGQPIEATVIQRFPGTKGTIRYSAVRILGRVGGADSLPVLAAAAPGGDSELRVLLEQAQKSIRTRLGQ
ncbi:MAG: hypothetical protein V4819_17980 [Verrucomicrobiota bacterium]